MKEQETKINYSGITWDDNKQQWHYRLCIGKAFNTEGWCNNRETAVINYREALVDSRAYFNLAKEIMKDNY